MREAVLLSSLLTNAETWINITKKGLEKPDMTLQRKMLSASGNPSKSFIMIELGIIPVKFVIMQKQKKLLTAHIT